MSLVRPGLKSDGRTRGTYVYLLLCQLSDTIYLKAGHSRDPVRRLKQIVVTCPTEPQLLAVAELPTHTRALEAERALHLAFKPWHTRGEWFAFELQHKELFNAAWRSALREFVTPSWPISWTKMAVKPILAQSRSARGLVRRSHGRRGRAYRDFKRDDNRA